MLSQLFFNEKFLNATAEPTKQKQNHRLGKSTYGYQRGKVGGGVYKLGVWDWYIHITIFKMDDQQGPTV